MTFTAKYHGTCGSCTEHITPGERVDYAEDDLVHADCEQAAPRERPTTVCPTCHLTRPCDCEAD